MRKNRYVRWVLSCDEDGLIWLWSDSKFNIYSMEIEEIHKYLAEYVKPFDDLIYRGFMDEEKTVKGKKFLEFYHDT